MLRFDANITQLYADLPFLDRFAAAAADGFKGSSFIFAALDRLGYDGWIGCEYSPAGNTSDGLGWMRDALAR